MCTAGTGKVQYGMSHAPMMLVALAACCFLSDMDGCHTKATKGAVAASHPFATYFEVSAIV